jgi:hypothetical protein
MGAHLMTLPEIIAQAYGHEQAERFRHYELSDADRNTIIEAGLFVLKTIPFSKSANACAHMSALWAATIRDNTSIPVHVASGNLSITGKRIYHSESPVKNSQPADLQYLFRP